ncbi:uncharacterized protein LOC127279472 [Leptopilina boulardi]|uniref:uncharacterized protein LOC127279472 n=1 Tax=Leptopilina boulardi TaxID=63433 RepID=UPI0021F6405A|nr:uncharacterized protein LOC127279472 [Leptopilina boulardi]
MSLSTSFVKTTIIALGVSVSLTQLVSKFIVPEWIRNYSNCYKDAIDSLHDHQEAVKLLGEPIKENFIKFNGSKDNGATKKFVWYTVPVEGSKSSGKLRYWVTRNTKGGMHFTVARIELAVDDLPDKILLIKQSDVLK